MQKVSIVFTGGGTAGHVTPNLAIIPLIREKLKNIELDVHYIGSETGIEKEMIEKYPDITYHSVRTGKLRRYFSWKNFRFGTFSSSISLKVFGPSYERAFLFISSYM